MEINLLLLSVEKKYEQQVRGANTNLALTIWMIGDVVQHQNYSDQLNRNQKLWWWQPIFLEETVCEEEEEWVIYIDDLCGKLTDRIRVQTFTVWGEWY